MIKHKNIKTIIITMSLALLIVGGINKSVYATGGGNISVGGEYDAYKGETQGSNGSNTKSSGSSTSKPIPAQHIPQYSSTPSYVKEMTPAEASIAAIDWATLTRKIDIGINGGSGINKISGGGSGNSTSGTNGGKTVNPKNSEYPSRKPSIIFIVSQL